MALLALARAVGLKAELLLARKIEQDARPQPDRPIRQALVPTEQVVEIKNGKKVK